MPPDPESQTSPPVTSILTTGDVPDHMADMSSDEAALAALGYKQEFKREFSGWTTFAVSFAVMGLLPSIGTTMWYGLGYAGPAANTWGWILSVIFILCVAMSMAELASSMPTSGGLYYAATVLAGPKYGPLAAWITGWANWLVQVTGAPSVSFGCAGMILAVASMKNPGYVPTDWQTFLLTVLIMIFQSILSSMPTRWIANFNSVGTIINIACLLITIIVIPAAAKTSPKFQPSDFAWGIQNLTDWPDGVSVMMSFLAIAWTMSGYDSSFHLAEECSNAAVATPRSIVMTAASGSVFGFILNTLIAYTIQDVEAIFESDLGQPWAAYLLQVLPENTAIAVLAMTIVCAFSMGQGCMVSASRVCFAYARDDCYGFLSPILKQVNRHTLTPVNAVWFNTLIGVLCMLLLFGGDASITAIFSIGAVGAYIAFVLPVFVKIVFVGNNFRPGPWNLGKLSVPIGIVSCTFALVIIPIFCFPSYAGANLTAADMNWTCVVFFGPMLGFILWFVVDAHKWFKGPKVNIEHHMHRREPITEGIIVKDPLYTQGESDGDKDYALKAAT